MLQCYYRIKGGVEGKTNLSNKIKDLADFAWGVHGPWGCSTLILYDNYKILGFFVLTTFQNTPINSPLRNMHFSSLSYVRGTTILCCDVS